MNVSMLDALRFRPDYQLVAELTTALAVATTSNDPISLKPERDGIIVSVEASAWDPANSNQSAATGGYEAFNQNWGAAEKLLACEWKTDQQSRTAGKYLPLIHVGGTGVAPKPVLIGITRATVLTVTFRNVATVGPSLVGRVVFNMISSANFGEVRRMLGGGG